MQSLGADEVIDYTSQDVAQTLLSSFTISGHNYLIVDCVGGTELIPAYVVPLFPSISHESTLDRN